MSSILVQGSTSLFTTGLVTKQSSVHQPVCNKHIVTWKEYSPTLKITDALQSTSDVRDDRIEDDRVGLFPVQWFYISLLWATGIDQCFFVVKLHLMRALLSPSTLFWGPAWAWQEQRNLKEKKDRTKKFSFWDNLTKNNHMTTAYFLWQTKP